MRSKLSALMQHIVLGISMSLAVAGQANAADINLGNQLPPSQLSIGNTFAGTAGAFNDNYLFSIPAASTDSITSTISLGSIFGINSLQTSLYSGASIVSGVPSGSLMASSNLLTFNGAGWTSSSAIINPIMLTAGSYILHVAGNVSGTSGGSYSGILNIASVPEASEWALMLLGFGLIGFIANRRQRDTEFSPA
jgi:hypothetical protein